MLNLLIYFLKKDMKTRYAGSGLGLLWAFLLPLFQILLYWFVFSIIMKARPYGGAKISYIYFLLSSFFFWLAFAEGLGRSASIIVENAEIVKKVSFPHVILPLTVTLSSYVNNMIGFVIFIVFYVVTTTFHPLFLLVIPVLLMQIAFSAGLGMIFSSLVPYMRDLTQVLGYIIQGMFFLSPIMYSVDSLPQKFRMLISLNPMTYFATAYQNIILFQKLPELSHLMIIVSLAFFTITAGFFVFRKLRDGFADVL